MIAQISEIKMRMQADRAQLATLMEENGKLQAELNNTRSELQVAESQVEVGECLLYRKF